MLYGTLRGAARVALHWYYSEVNIQGRERIPARGPVLVVANHPNALIDAMLVGISLPRRVLLTAKATLFEHPLLAPFLVSVGVVPLRRIADEPTGTLRSGSVSRNADAFRLVLDALRHNRVVLVFPEGMSHDAPALAPLRSGASRMALRAHEMGTRDLHILPMGLVFEEKERPRSRVLVRIGDPIDLDAWCATEPSANAAALTKEIDARLRQVTLNFATEARAQRAIRVSRALAAIAGEPSGLGTTHAFVSETLIAQRVEAATEALEHAPVALIEAADSLSARLESLEARLSERGAAFADVKVSTRIPHGITFAVRETTITVLILPLAILGRLTHWLPIRLARTLAIRSLSGDPSRDQPAMRTILLGTVAIISWYTLQAAVVTYWIGWLAAALWLTTIFIAAQLDLLLNARLERAWQRARTYFVLRGDPRFRTTVLADIESLLADAIALEGALTRRGSFESPA